jgi:ABC-type Fe3+ transport system permease subunit
VVAVSLVLGAVMLVLVVLVVLPRGTLRRRRTATAPRLSSRPARGWVWLNTVILVGALAVLGANQLFFVGLGHDGAHRACARADVAPYGVGPTVGYEAQWSFFPPTLICRYSSDVGDPGKDFTADLFPAGARTFWAGLTALVCSITAGLLFRSTRRTRETAPDGLQRDTAGL